MLMELTKRFQTKAPQLMISEHDQEKILAETGFQNVLDYQRKKRLEIVMMNRFGPAIARNELMRVGLKYGMVLTRPLNYKGLVGPEQQERLMTFVAEHKVKPETGFYVLCPYELSESFRKFAHSKRAEWIEAQRDPVLLYENDAGMFHVVDQWGGDMNVFRRISVAFKKIHMYVYNWTLGAAVTGLATYAAFHSTGSALSCISGAVAIVGGILLRYQVLFWSEQ